MEDKEFSELLKREQELAAQLEALRKQQLELTTMRKAAEEQRKLQEPCEVRVREYYGGTVNIKLPARNDVRNLVLNTPETYHQAYNEQAMVPIKYWSKLTEQLQTLPNVTLVYNKGIEEEIEWHLTAPNWYVELTPQYFKATPGPSASGANLIHRIPGTNYYSTGKRPFYGIPLTEAQKLFEVLQELEGAVFESAAIDFVEKEIKREQQLNKVATQTHAPHIRANLKGLTLQKEQRSFGEALFDFQTVGIDFGIKANNVLIADEMGLGKTWQALGVALLKRAKKVLVVCPGSLRLNWARHIRNITGEGVYHFSGRVPHPNAIVQLLSPTGSRFFIINYEVLRTKIDDLKETKNADGTTTTKREVTYPWADILSSANIDVLIIDESHYIKNHESNQSIATRKLTNIPVKIALTGTPVLNRPGEYWPTLNLLKPELFPQHDLFVRQYTYDGKIARNVKELQSVLRPIMIRRLKKNVVQELPPINRITHYHELSPKALKIYNRVMQGLWEAVAEFDARGQTSQKEVTNILTQIMRLKQVCAIDKIDRAAELATEAHDSSENGDVNKVLLFSQFKPVAYAIAQRLGHEALCFVSRTPREFKTANDQERDRLVQEFRDNSNYKYLVVTEKTAKEGHDITAAGTVIFNDLFWTPAAHQQGEGRSYGRLEKLHSINSLYLVTDMDGQSIEEWIWQLLERKMRTIEQVVEGVEISRRDGEGSIVTELIDQMRGMLWQRKKK